MADRARERRKSDAAAWANDPGRTFEATSVQLPDGMEWYQLKPGTVLVDFMSYLAGPGNPRADEGMEHFEREYSAHRVPMPNGKKSLYCCLWETFKMPCPICSWMNSVEGRAAGQLSKDLLPQVRHLWLVNDRPGDANNPLKVFDSNHFNKKMGFGEMMQTAMRAVPDYLRFADPENGYTVQLIIQEVAGGGFKYNAVTRIDFLPRRYNYPVEVIDRAPCLDTMLIAMPYDKLLQIFKQEPPQQAAPQDGRAWSPGTSIAPPSGPPPLQTTPAQQQPTAQRPYAPLPPTPPPAQMMPPAPVVNNPPLRQPVQQQSGFQVGDVVTFDYRGTMNVGKIIKVSIERQLAQVDCGKTPYNIVALADLSRPAPAAPPAPTVDDGGWIDSPMMTAPPAPGGQPQPAPADDWGDVPPTPQQPPQAPQTQGAMPQDNWDDFGPVPGSSPQQAPPKGRQPRSKKA